MEECGPCPVLASYTLAFALQPRKKHGITSVRVAASVGVCRTHERDEICTKNLVGKYEAEISRCRWKDITKIDVKERLGDVVCWIQLLKNRKISAIF